MGTRSLTIMVDASWGAEIVVMYRQMDGYPAGHGRDLAEFLKDMVIVNGLGVGQPEKVANGADCLAAQIVAEFKTGPGSIYLYPAGARDAGERWRYYVRASQSRGIEIEVERIMEDGNWGTVFSGSPAEMLEWIEGSE